MTRNSTAHGAAAQTNDHERKPEPSSVEANDCGSEE